jgi:excisionase family DNA binding protein
MFTVKQAAEELLLSEALIYKLVAAGKIRHERHGMGRGVIRIPKDALDEYREKCTRAELFSAPVKPTRIMRRQFKHLKL